ncbi:hypothetical protein [Streptomyces sp. O3]
MQLYVIGSPLVPESWSGQTAARRKPNVKSWGLIMRILGMPRVAAAITMIATGFFGLVGMGAAHGDSTAGGGALVTAATAEGPQDDGWP